MPKVNLMTEVRPYAVSVVKRGANRKQFYLRKQDGAVLDEQPAGEATELEELSATGIVLHKADWSVVYCVVAEPGHLENCGMNGDPEIPDQWASEEEIRKAAHYFMKSGALVNRMHEDLEPYGSLVENFIAQADMQVAGEVIKAGSWVIGIEPTDDGRALIESGEFTGVSIQGTGVRSLVEKADPKAQGTKGKDRASSSSYSKCGSCGSKLKRGASSCPNCKSSSVKKAKVPITNKPGKTNWVEAAGGLPTKIRKVAEELKGQGKTDQQAIRLAVGIVKNWAAGHDGKGGKVSAKTQAEAAKAIAKWEKMKAGTITKGSTMNRLTAAIAKAVGIDPDAPEFADDALLEELSEEEAAELLKAGGPTFAQIQGRRELSDELPQAMDSLRESLYNAFYPYTGEGEPDAAEIRASLETSLEEFGDYMLKLYDGIAGGTIVKAEGALRDEIATLMPDADQEEDEVITDEQFEALEKKVDTLVDGLAPVIAKAAAEAEAAKQPSAEELSKKLDDALAAVDGIKTDLAKLGEGGTTTNADSVVKTDAPELSEKAKLAKALL